MSNKVMKIAGKTADDIVQPIAVTEDGATIVKRIWETYNTNILATNVTNGTASHSTVFDASEWGFVSIRIVYWKIDGVTDMPPLKVNVYADRSDNDGTYLKDIEGNFITFTVNYGDFVIITPDNLPVLNYLKYIRLRFELESPTPDGVSDPYVNAYLFAKR